MTSPKKAIAAVAVAVALLTACSTSVEEGPQPLTREASDDDFVDITDCRELELLAAAEVDRISDTDDQKTINEATSRFDRIVAHRDSVC